MSRGMGQIERRLLTIFAKKFGQLDTFELTGDVYKIRRNRQGDRLMTEAQLSSVRRALNSLASQGIVGGCRGFHNRRKRWKIIKPI